MRVFIGQIYKKLFVWGMKLNTIGNDTIIIYSF